MCEKKGYWENIWSLIEHGYWRIRNTQEIYKLYLRVDLDIIVVIRRKWLEWSRHLIGMEKKIGLLRRFLTINQKDEER